MEKESHEENNMDGLEPKGWIEKFNGGSWRRMHGASKT
jgi:hypothetical protein